MSTSSIVIHYHEAWLKGGNRQYFLGKLASALRQALAGLPLERLERPGDRFLVHFRPGFRTADAVGRIQRVCGVANFALARAVQHDLGALCQAALQEMWPLEFETFAVRAKRSDKSFPHRVMDIEAAVGRYLLEQLQAAGRQAKVQLREPEVTCRIEITPGPALVYARKYPGPGGLPANTTGRMMGLLSGGFDSAVAAYRMMLRGAHLSFVHFFNRGAAPGDSSVHVVRELVRILARYQFTAKLYRVPLDDIQRQIVLVAPEAFRILLYRRMMVRIAEALARREHALALVTGDSLGQVASQTLHNMVAVEAVAGMPIFRPLAGTDKLEIMAQARAIGTYDVSAEPFHDCCPVFLPRAPALHARPWELEEAEANLDVLGLAREGVRSAAVERFRYVAGEVISAGASLAAAAGHNVSA